MIGEARTDKSIFDTCEAFATALCDDSSELYKQDLDYLRSSGKFKYSGSGKRWKPVEQFKHWMFVKGLTSSPSIKPLLDDMRGERISLPIMLVILRCMLRSKKDSFVKPGIGEEGKPISAWRLEKKAGECAELCASLVTCPSSRADLEEWITLGSRADDLFLALRIASCPDSHEPSPRKEATPPVLPQA
jgi:hypothetical protein